MAAKGVRRARVRGPVGAGRGRKFQKTSQSYLPAGITRDGKKILASIYFAVSGHAVLGDDVDVLTLVASHCLDRLLKAEDVRLRIEGHADERYLEDFNQSLSADRAAAVEAFLRNVSITGSPRLPDYRAFRISHRGFGEKQAGSNWAEDRRADVVDVSPRLTKGKRGFFFYMNNQNLLRRCIFQKYYPRFWLWSRRKLEYLVDLYEKEGRGMGAHLIIRPADYDKVMEIIEQIADYHDFQKIRADYQSGDRGKVVTQAYEVEYRKAWQEASARAERDFDRSDFRHPWEFFAIECGHVPKTTPYHRRPLPGEPRGYVGTPTYYKWIEGH